jgi:cob(I)alamin adenosyltransferase
MKLNKGYVHIYTGNGKGKTSAAIGIAVRAAGAGLKTYFAQLMKSYLYSELISLKKISEIKTVQFGDDNFVLEKRKPNEKELTTARDALAKIEKIMLSGEYDIIVIDEALVSVYFGLITNRDIFDLIDKKPENVELILTGRYADKSIIEKADIVSEIKEVKHYYSKGILSRKGIDS